MLGLCKFQVENTNNRAVMYFCKGSQVLLVNPFIALGHQRTTKNKYGERFNALSQRLTIFTVHGGHQALT